LQINFGKTEYLILDPGAGIVTETGQIKAVNKFKYLGSSLETIGATTLEIEKNVSEGRRVIGMLNSVLWSKNILHKTKKTHVSGFNPKYFNIWGRNMDTKRTGEQITGNGDGFLEKICEKIKETKGPKCHH
jgi:hypothetical protein